MGEANGKRVSRVVEAEQMLRAWQLSCDGFTHRQIAVELGVSHGTVANRLNAYLRDRIEPAIEDLRQLELERLDALTRQAQAILQSEQVLVQHGRIVRDNDGEPLVDKDLALRAMDRIARFSDARCKLLGLHAPLKIDARYPDRVVPEDLALMKVIREAQAKNARIEAEIKGTQDNPQSEGNAA